MQLRQRWYAAAATRKKEKKKPSEVNCETTVNIEQVIVFICFALVVKFYAIPQ